MITNPENLSPERDAPSGDNWPVEILESFMDELQAFRSTATRARMMDDELFGMLEKLEQGLEQRIEGFNDANRF